MPRTELSDSAQDNSQIVPLSGQKPRKQPKPKHLVPPRLTTNEKLVEAQCEIERIQRELLMREGEIYRLKEKCESIDCQWIYQCRAKDRCLNAEVEYLKTGLNHGIWESRIQMKRRISQLCSWGSINGSTRRFGTIYQRAHEIAGKPTEARTSIKQKISETTEKGLDIPVNDMYRMYNHGR